MPPRLLRRAPRGAGSCACPSATRWRRWRATASKAGVELLPPEADIAEADLVIVLGGDGSVLRALQRVTGRGVPVFGVNFGRVGFLTTTQPEDLETAVRRALAGDLRVVEFATVQVERDGERTGIAVNDVVGREQRAGSHRAPAGWNASTARRGSGRAWPGDAV